MADNLNSATSLHNPFRTFTNYIYPSNMHQVFVWAKWFWNRHHKYSTSISKVVSYFVSGITVTADGDTADTDSSDTEGFQKLLLDNYRLLQLTMQCGTQLASMGNVFVSAQRVFTRDLLCPQQGCGFSMALNKMRKNVDYRWSGGKFSGKCPQCGRSIQYKVSDTVSHDAKGRRVRFVFRSAQDMRLSHNELTGQYKFLFKLPEHIRSAIVRGQAVYLETTPQLYIDAALTNGYIEFEPDKLFHMRTRTLTELDKLYRGWGVPIFLASFGNLIRLAMLDRFNEAVVAQYIAPLRMLSPPPQILKAGMDPVRSNPVSGAQLKNMIGSALKSAIGNPTTWVISPFPMNYQMLGGQAKQMAPVELMEWYVGQILSDMGIPQEFRQTSFQMVGPTMGLRMFEKMWIHFAKDLGEFVTWSAEHISGAHDMGKMEVSLDMTSFVEDDANKQVRLQLAMNNQLSKQEGYKPFGIDYSKDRKQRMSEQREDMEAMTKEEAGAQGMQMVSSVLPPGGSVGVGAAQANIQAVQNAAQGGAPAQPGMPMAPAAPAGAGAPAGMPAMPFSQGNSQSATIEALYQQAEQEAQRIYSVGQESGSGARIAELRSLKTGNKTLHAQVMAILGDMDSQVASQAVAQSKGPQQG